MSDKIQKPNYHIRNARKDRKKYKMSSTAGSTKGGTCQASYLDRYICKHNRSYKIPEYQEWLERTRKTADNK